MEIMSKPPANTENLVYVWVIIIKDKKIYMEIINKKLKYYK
jgi:hypothetical protein